MALGNNNDLSVRRYEKQYKDLLQTFYNKKAYFGDFSAGGVEVLDGVKENATAFTIKTTDIPVVVGTYNTGTNVAFGTGTANSSRFGNMTEVIYSNIDVPYTSTWAIHEGLDRYTVNAELDAAVADRLFLQAQAQTRTLDKAASDYLAAQAGKTEALTAVATATVETLFDNLSKYYLDLEVDTEGLVAGVNGDVYNVIIASSLAVREKGSSVNIDNDTIVKFKGFEIRPIPTSKMPTGLATIVYPKGVGKTFVGISTARTIPAVDFDGTELQGAGKYGTYILPDNKAAIVKVTAPTPPGP